MRYDDGIPQITIGELEERQRLKCESIAALADVRPYKKNQPTRDAQAGNSVDCRMVTRLTVDASE